MSTGAEIPAPPDSPQIPTSPPGSRSRSRCCPPRPPPRLASQKLSETLSELDGLDGERLRERGRAFYAQFVQKIPLLLRGTMAAPPERFGETLADEHVRGGTFVGEDGRPLAVRPGSGGGSPGGIANAEMRLFGGAQYHRALEEFRTVVGGVTCPPVGREEIVNACGIDEVHDGVNYTRTACVIAVAKARPLGRRGDGPGGRAGGGAGGLGGLADPPRRPATRSSRSSTSWASGWRTSCGGCCPSPCSCCRRRAAS